MDRAGAARRLRRIRLALMADADVSTPDIRGTLRQHFEAMIEALEATDYETFRRERDLLLQEIKDLSRFVDRASAV